jgi:small subunit ribosomal protein S13
MAYFLGINIIDKKKIRIGLTKIYGIGPNNAKYICKNLGFTENICTHQLTETQTFKLSRFLNNLDINTGPDLKQQILIFKKRLLNIKSYRGIRYNYGFPIRGQRTRTNAKTSKRLHKKKKT